MRQKLSLWSAVFRAPQTTCSEHVPQSMIGDKSRENLSGLSSLMPGRHLLSFDSDSWDIYFETPGKYKYIDIYL